MRYLPKHTFRKYYFCDGATTPPAPALGPGPALKRKRYLVKELYQILMKLYPAKAFPFQSWGHSPRPDMGRPPGAGNVQPLGPARETRGVTFVNLIRKTTGQSDP